MQPSVEVLKVIIYKGWCKWNLPQWKENKFFINIQLSLSHFWIQYALSSLTVQGQQYLLRWPFEFHHDEGFFKFQISVITLLINSEPYCRRRCSNKRHVSFPESPMAPFAVFLNEWAAWPLFVLPDWIANCVHPPHTQNALWLHSLGF